MDWLYSSRNLIKNKNIFQLIIPGSHNSGTYSCRRKNGISPDHVGPKWIYKIPFFASKWIVDQPDDIYQQLKTGIRWFDFRVGKDPEGVFRVYHSYYGEEFRNIFTQIIRFHREHPEEFIIINLRKFLLSNGRGFDLEQHQLFYYQCLEILTPYLISAENSRDTLETLWERPKQRILIIYGDNDPHVSLVIPQLIIKNYVLDGFTKLIDIWPNKPYLNQALHYLDQSIPHANWKWTLIQSQIITTPDFYKILKGFLLPCVFAYSTKTEAGRNKKRILGWCQKNFYRLNLVLLDWVTPDLVQHFIDLNLKKATEISI